jgi:hypothetical protein
VQAQQLRDPDSVSEYEPARVPRIRLDQEDAGQQSRPGIIQRWRARERIEQALGRLDVHLARSDVVFDGAIGEDGEKACGPIQADAIEAPFRKDPFVLPEEGVPVDDGKARMQGRIIHAQQRVGLLPRRQLWQSRPRREPLLGFGGAHGPRVY